MSEIIGKIKLIKDTQQISEKFAKREFVIETAEQYPQTILLEFQGQNVDMIDAYAEGQEVKLFIEIRGRMWANPQGEEKYFNTIVAKSIQPL